METKQLFVKTLDDIEKRLTSRDEYEILLIAGLLRKLLLDGDSLINQVITTEKLKIEFVVNDKSAPTTPPIPVFWSIEDGIDPETSPPFLINPIKVNKENLLKRPVIQCDGKIVTVKDLIRHMAHVEGAVHPGLPKTDEEKILKELGQTLGIGGLPAGIRLLKAIARIVLKGLEPLKTKIAN